MSVFNLDKSMGPCLIKALYIAALVVIALGLLRGIVGGVRMMSGPPPAPVAAVMPPGAAAPGMPPQMAPGAMPGNRPGFVFGPRGRRFAGPPRPGFMAGPLLRGWPPAALGAARIVFALLRALVMAMVIRVLAEMGLGILAMGAKARA
jgi:hypothetical protein